LGVLAKAKLNKINLEGESLNKIANADIIEVSLDESLKVNANIM